MLHRFVGYLEETAVHTYTNIVEMTNTPGTKLHTAWKDVPAPQAAIDYWKVHRNTSGPTVGCRTMLSTDLHLI